MPQIKRANYENRKAPKKRLIDLGWCIGILEQTGQVFSLRIISPSDVNSESFQMIPGQDIQIYGKEYLERLRDELNEILKED